MKRWLILFGLFLAVHPHPTMAQGNQEVSKTLAALLPFEAVGASAIETSAAYDRIQEELLATGQFILVERDQINSILNEQALQQAACTEGECAVKVGRILGVRKILTGKVTKLDAEHWVITGRMTDVETAQTMRATSIQYEGKYFDLLRDGTPILAAKLAGLPPPEKPGFLGQVLDIAAIPIAKITTFAEKKEGLGPKRGRSGYLLSSGVFQFAGDLITEAGNTIYFSAGGGPIISVGYQWLFFDHFNFSLLFNNGDVRVTGELSNYYTSMHGIANGSNIKYLIRDYYIGAVAYSVYSKFESTKGPFLVLRGRAYGISIGKYWDNIYIGYDTFSSNQTVDEGKSTPEALIAPNGEKLKKASISQTIIRIGYLF